MSSQSQTKISAERNQRTLLELAQKPGNDICADCKVRNPRWASYNLGIFICMNCASIHRKIGTHVTKVKSLTMDSWTKEQVETMKEFGNVKSNAIYNPNEIRNPPPPNLEESERDSELEQYIRGKYQYRRFIDKSALVASKLGPSRSSSSAIPSSKTPEPAKRTFDANVTSSATTTSTDKPTRPLTASGSVGQSHVPSNVLEQRNLSQTRSVSHPTLPQSSTSTAQPSQNGVWADLISIQGPSASSSLPLQYQQVQNTQTMNGQPMITNHFTSAPQSTLMSGSGGYIGGSGTMQQQFSTNPWSQQSLSAVPSTQFGSAFTGNVSFTPQVQQNLGQQFRPNLLISPTPVTVAGQSSGQTFPYQHGSNLQIQTQGFVGSTPSPMTPFMSVPNDQSQFLTPSPVQFMSQNSSQLMSHSPQPQMQFQQQGQNTYLSHSPQPQMQQGQTTFMSHSPQPMATNMGQQQQMQMMGGMQQQLSPSNGVQFQTNQFMSQMMPQGQQQFGGGFQSQGHQWGGL